MSANERRRPGGPGRQGGHGGGRPGGGPGGGGPGAMMPGEKASDFGGTMKRFLSFTSQYKILLLLVVIFAVVSTAMSVFNPKILGMITDQVANDFMRSQVYDAITENLGPEQLKQMVDTMLPAGMATQNTDGSYTLPEGVIVNPDYTLGEGTTGEKLFALLAQVQEMQRQNGIEPESGSADFESLPESQRNLIMEWDFSQKPTYDFGRMADIAKILIVLYVISSLLSYVQGWIMNNVSNNVTYRMRKELSEKINRLPLRYFDRSSQGDVLSRITNDVDTISQTLNQSLSQMISSVTTVIGVVIMMLTISWQMTLIALFVLPVSVLIIRVVVGKSQGFFSGQQKYLGTVNGHIEEMYSSHNVVRVFNGEQRSINKFEENNEELYNYSWKAQFISGVMMPLMNFVSNLGYVGISVLGGYLAINGRIGIGDIQAFIQYVRNLNQPIGQISNIMNILQSTAAAAERVFEFMDEDEESPDVEDPSVLRDPKGFVCFRNVEFGYTPDKQIIKGFTVDIEPGSRIAIVGPTGAGKTTIVNLLMRFYDVDSGHIYIDGADTMHLRRKDLRDLFGMVLQDTWLFSGTIKENIAYGKPEASDDEIIDAAKAAYVHHFIMSLPDGYETELNEEASNLSQGQRQLITIARAMLHDAPMLILDEATSSVDTRTEVRIQQAMDNLMKGRTSFIIAHRLSTIKDADLILVMRDGNIIEQGSHDELITADGFYASLYNSQFADFDEAEKHMA